MEIKLAWLQQQLIVKMNADGNKTKKRRLK